MRVVFRFPTPKSRTKTQQAANSGYKVGKPDLDKLCRALGDSLAAGGLIARDELIVWWTATKIETTNWTGAYVTVYEPEDVR